MPPAPPLTPVVLAHGLLGVGDVGVGPLRLSYFHKIDRAVAARGHPVITPRVHPTGGIETRAAQLKQQILRSLDDLHRRGKLPAGGKCVVIGHSMGGLDARFMLTHLGMADRVSALVTVATPHRGSPFADWTLRHFDARLGIARRAAFFGLDMRAWADLTGDFCRRFNAITPDAPGVAYLSVGAGRPTLRTSPFLMVSQKIIEAAEGLNDGLVSVASARWGEYLGTWPADHLHTINKRFVFERAGDRTGDITPRYLEILDTLAGRGLLQAGPQRGPGRVVRTPGPEPRCGPAS